MKLDHFTEKAQEAVFQSQQIVHEFNHQSIEPAHLLLAILRQEDGVAPAAVAEIAGRVAPLEVEITQDLQQRPKVYGSNVQAGMARATSDTLNAAEKHAQQMNDEYTSVEHILLALTKGVEGERLARHGVTADSIFKALKKV
ncbi:MAG: type VI secretion system ATPase TssH, partial [Chloroflexi bacterium]|nr:type VI secretion system ATPase TssH [Chloroflexota bacterium]